MKERNLSLLLGQAVNDYRMIEDGDRIAVGISGGMDSLALLLLLHFRLQRIPVDYALLPVFVDNFNGLNDAHNARIEELGHYIRSMTGLEMAVLRIPAVAALTGGKVKKRDLCYQCSARRRGVLIRYATENGCGRLALGHHRDDIVETSLMNLFYGKELSAMVPRLDILDGRLDIIRPLAYISKARIESYIYEREDIPPIFGEVCPAKMERKDLRREKVREIAGYLDRTVPHFRDNVFAALRNVKKDYLLDHLFTPMSAGRFKRP